MAEKMKSAEAAAPLIDNGDVKKLLSLLSKVEGDRAKEFSQLIAYVDAMGRQFDRVSAELAPLRSFRDIVEHMEQSAGKAVGQLEKLEQAAARKPSVLDNLKKAEKPEKAAPAPKRAEPEAAL